MKDALFRLELRFQELESLLADPSTLGDVRRLKALSKEHAELIEAMELARRWRACLKALADTETLLEESSGELKELAFQELQELKVQSQDLEFQIRIALLPKDPHDGKNILLEIRAGAGGDEASLFSAEMFRAYSRYADKKRWKFEVLSISENELGGFKEAIASIEGENVYRTLKYESGVHRVQRVPSTETQGRTHTSTITVAVLPEADDVEVSIKDSDLRIDTYRASGAGGQHVNRTDSAVRITHLPTGLVVACQDERSQIKNRYRAMKILQARLLEKAQEEQDKAIAEDRRQQVGRGDRSERIRTYNFPQSRITDHRVGVTIHSILEFMSGDMEGLFAHIAQHYQNQQMALQAQGQN